MTRARMFLMGIALVLGACPCWAQAPDLANMDLVEKSVPDGPVAKVQGVNITPEEFLSLYKGELQMAQMRNSGEAPDDFLRVGVGLKCMRALIEREILYQEAEKRGLTIPDTELQKSWDIELDRLRESMSRGSDKDITEEQILAEAGATREEGMRELRKALLIEKMKAELVKASGVKVTDAEVREFYEKEKDRFRQPDLFHLKQLFIRSLRNAAGEGNTTREEARARIETALKRIRAGESFEAVAKSVSEGPFRDNGGDLGLTPANELPPFFIDPAASMQPGAMSDIIESEYGFHVIKLVEFKPGVEVGFDKAGPVIRERLLAERGEQAASEFCRSTMENEEAVQVFLELDKTLAAHPDLRDLLPKEAPPE